MPSSSSDDDVPQGKKRLVNQSNWKQNIKKRKVVSGQEYTGSSGKIVPKKSTGPNCHCKRHCFDKFTHERKERILSSFYEIADKEKQDAHLSGMMKMKKVQRRRPTTSTKAPRTAAYVYEIPVNELLLFVVFQCFQKI